MVRHPLVAAKVSASTPGVGEHVTVVLVILVSAGQHDALASLLCCPGNAPHGRAMNTILRHLDPHQPGLTHGHAGDGPEVVLGNLGANLRTALASEALSPVPVVAKQLFLLHLLTSTDDVIIILT